MKLISIVNNLVTEGLNLAKKPALSYRYFMLTICPWGWENDECEGEWDFIYLKIPANDIMDLQTVETPFHDSMYIVLRVALAAGQIEKYVLDQAHDIVEINEEQYNEYEGIEEED